MSRPAAFAFKYNNCQRYVRRGKKFSCVSADKSITLFLLSNIFSPSENGDGHSL